MRGPDRKAKAPLGPPVVGAAATQIRSVSLLLSVCGMLVTALLLGLVSDAIGSKVDDLRKGKAPVLECDHTLVIGVGYERGEGGDAGREGGGWVGCPKGAE